MVRSGKSPALDTDIEEAQTGGNSFTGRIYNNDDTHYNHAQKALLVWLEVRINGFVGWSNFVLSVAVFDVGPKVNQLHQETLDNKTLGQILIPTFSQR